MNQMCIYVLQIPYDAGYFAQFRQSGFLTILIFSIFGFHCFWVLGFLLRLQI